MTAERDLVFNVVWTGSVFPYLRYFVRSQIEFGAARYRFVANGCPADQIELMERFAARWPDRVVEVLVTSEAMEPHGASLDRVLALRDDGDFFCLVDPDILARGPFLSLFLDELATCAAISSGRGVWRDDDVIPEGQLGVSGEYFYSQDGFLFGSPHFAIYRRDALDATRSRWGVRFGEGGKDLSQAARERLTASGHDYFIYDTGKLVNIFLQEDGNVMRHAEHPNLMHIGGLSHYLAPPRMVRNEGATEPEPDWARWQGMSTRFEVARFTAAVLRSLCAGHGPLALPCGLDAAVATKLEQVHAALGTMVGRHYDELHAE